MDTNERMTGARIIQKAKVNPPAVGQNYSCNRPVTVIPELNSGQALTKVRIYCFLTITQIPDQVRNDGTAVVILTNSPAGGQKLKVQIKMQKSINFKF